MYAEANGTDILTRMATTVQRSERTWNFVTGAETRDRAEQLRKGFSAPTNSLSALGSYSPICPATALAATVSGLARYICPGPLRPGKLRFCALITTCSGRVVTPGPALMHAPQLGSIP